MLLVSVDIAAIRSVTVLICSSAALRPVTIRSMLVEQITQVWPVKTSGSAWVCSDIIFFPLYKHKTLVGEGWRLCVSKDEGFIVEKVKAGGRAPSGHHSVPVQCLFSAGQQYAGTGESIVAVEDDFRTAVNIVLQPASQNIESDFSG